jgi:DUF4097 and DUF4098 domain-containing protein YvlB
VSASTGGGDVTADNLASTLSLSTSGGNINGSALASQHVTAHSLGGDVTLAFTSPPQNLVITTSGGNITVALPHNAAGYDVTTSSDGGSVSDQVSNNSSSPDKITADSVGGDIAITEAG